MFPGNWFQGTHLVITLHRSFRKVPVVCKHALLPRSARAHPNHPSEKGAELARLGQWGSSAVDLEGVSTLLPYHTHAFPPSQQNNLLHVAYISSVTKQKPIAFTLTKTHLANRMISESSFVSIIIPPIGVKSQWRKSSLVWPSLSSVSPSIFCCPQVLMSQKCFPICSHVSVSHQEDWNICKHVLEHAGIKTGIKFYSPHS